MMSAARGHALLVSGSLVVCAALAFGAPRALAQGSGDRSPRPAETVPPGVEELWREYPLNPPNAPAAPTRTSTTRPGAADEDRDSLAKRMLWPGAFALAGLLSVLLLALFLGLRPASALGRLAPRPRRRFGVPRQAGRLWSRGFRVSAASLHRPFHRARKRLRARLPDIAALSTSEARPAAAEQEPVEPYARVAEQVTAVLTSAEQAADRIRESARQEAELIQTQANEKAAATIAEATRAAEQVRRESDDVRAKADRYGGETRDAANRQLEKMRREIRGEAAQRHAEAEQQAREILRAAEQETKDLELKADKRQKALVLRAERFETRLSHLVRIFSEITLQLEAVVGAEQAGPSGHAEREARAASLDDARNRRRSPVRSR